MELRDLFENGQWYHCIRHKGLVSNGVYDIDRYLQYYHFDKSYQGQTVLDVGCADGYFSLLMKERDAQRVCGVDSNKFDGSVAIQPSNFSKDVYARKYRSFVDDYARFQEIYAHYGLKNSNKLLLLAKLKQLDIEFRVGTIYDLTPYGMFDIVLCNDLLEHLRDPITAIEQLYFATGKKCIITVSSAMKTNWLMRKEPILTYQGHISGGSFYSLSESAVIAMCKAAGFAETITVSRFDMLNRRHNVKSRHFVVHAHK